MIYEPGVQEARIKPKPTHKPSTKSNDQFLIESDGMKQCNPHQVEIIQRGLDHAECVAFGPDGQLYAGGYNGQIYVMTPPKFELKELAQTEGIILGLALDGKNNVYACNQTKRCVQRISQDGKKSVFCNNSSDGELTLPNYGAFDRNGNYFLSDSGDFRLPSGRLIRVKPNGDSESVIGGNWHFLNGLAISPLDGSIFVVESTAADVLRVPVANDGTPGRPEIYAQLHGTVPDGLAFARSGNLYCSCFYPNRIYVITKEQNVELLVEDPMGDALNQPTNMAFEPNGTRLFFANCAGDHVGAIDVGEKGATLSYPLI